MVRGGRGWRRCYYEAGPSTCHPPSASMAMNHTGVHALAKRCTGRGLARPRLQQSTWLSDPLIDGQTAAGGGRSQIGHGIESPRPTRPRVACRRVPGPVSTGLRGFGGPLGRLRSPQTLVKMNDSETDAVGYGLREDGPLPGRDDTRMCIGADLTRQRPAASWPCGLPLPRAPIGQIWNLFLTDCE